MYKYMYFYMDISFWKNPKYIQRVCAEMYFCINWNYVYKLRFVGKLVYSLT